MKTKLLPLTLIALSACLWAAPKVDKEKEQKEETSKNNHRHHADSTCMFPELGDQGFCQSPINIQSTKSVEGHHEVKLGYYKSKQTVINKGHTIELDYDPGSTVEVDGKTYEFKQLHFHTPSEHLIDGVTYPMEIHMVHTLKGDPGKYLVMAILFKEGPANPFLTKLLANVPNKEGQHVVSEEVIDAGALLKGNKTGYYTYQGSLTTPPYSETVFWAILKQIHTASPEQIELIHKREGNNARVIQARAGRKIESQ